MCYFKAPEKKQPFGQKSKQSLSDCAYDKTATVEGDKLDRYGRLLGKVIVNGVDCNLRQINQGLAWHYKKYMTEQSQADQLIYTHAEDEARKTMLGCGLIQTPFRLESGVGVRVCL